MIKKLFGKPTSARAPANSASAASSRTSASIQALTENEEQLEKRRELLETRAAAELAKAQECLRQGRKPAALQCLRKKKLLEMEMEHLVRSPTVCGPAGPGLPAHTWCMWMACGWHVGGSMHTCRA